MSPDQATPLDPGRGPRFDATARRRLAEGAHDWIRLAGFHVDADIEVLDTNVSAAAAVDSAILVKSAQPWILRLEFQVSYQTNLPI